jgi:hypothetical protein
MFNQKDWETGTLFHNFHRFDQRGKVSVDRLPAILEEGLRAPAHCDDGHVVSDLNISVTGLRTAYDSLVFMHRYQGAGSISDLYLLGMQANNVCLVVDDQVPVKSPADMEAGWPVLCQDEVYSLEPIAPERFTGIYLREAYAREERVAQRLAVLDIVVHEL